MATSTSSSAITIVTVSVACSAPSVTFSVNRTGMSADTGGAMNVAFRVAEFRRVMGSDELWVHW